MFRTLFLAVYVFLTPAQEIGQHTHLVATAAECSAEIAKIAHEPIHAEVEPLYSFCIPIDIPTGEPA